MQPPSPTRFPYTTLARSESETTAMHLGSGSSWRAYYLARNHLRTALDRRSPTWLWGWAYRMIALSTSDVRRRRWDALGLRWKGRSEEHTSELKSRSDLVC